jgi:hypothetical protein
MSDPGDEKDDLIDLICEKGERVCSVEWNEDSGYPTGWVDEYYKFKNKYWWISCEFGLSDPADSLAEAMEGRVGIVHGLQSIDCTGITGAELAKRLPVMFR